MDDQFPSSADSPAGRVSPESARHREDTERTRTALACDDETPALGVHEMSEFLFCPCAGVIAAESQVDDDGTEFIPAPALAGITEYEVDRLLVTIERSEQRLLILTVLLLGPAVPGCVLTWVRDGQLGLAILLTVAAAALFVVPFLWLPAMMAWWSAKRQLRIAENTAAVEPDWDHRSVQEVHWWGLLRSGFESREVGDILQDDAIGLRGRPWRLLCRGELRIPVMRIRLNDDGEEFDAGTWPGLRYQQRARLTAYSYLVEACGVGRADWVIVLFQRSVTGIAVPVQTEEWQVLRDGLARARLLRTLEPEQAAAQADKNLCRRCPLGQPRLVGHRQTVIGKRKLIPFQVDAADWSGTYHSTCGDRFQTVRPHADAEQLGLV